MKVILRININNNFNSNNRHFSIYGIIRLSNHALSLSESDNVQKYFPTKQKKIFFEYKTENKSNQFMIGNHIKSAYFRQETKLTCFKNLNIFTVELHLSIILV